MNERFDDYERNRAREFSHHPSRAVILTPPVLALQPVTPCEHIGWACDLKASHRVITYGRSGLVIEDHLLCDLHTLAMCAGDNDTGYRIETTLLRADDGDMFDQLLAAPDIDEDA